MSCVLSVSPSPLSPLLCCHTAQKKIKDYQPKTAAPLHAHTNAPTLHAQDWMVLSIRSCDLPLFLFSPFRISFLPFPFPLYSAAKTTPPHNFAGCGRSGSKRCLGGRKRGGFLCAPVRMPLNTSIQMDGERGMPPHRHTPHSMHTHNPTQMGWDGWARWNCGLARRGECRCLLVGGTELGSDTVDPGVGEASRVARWLGRQG